MLAGANVQSSSQCHGKPGVLVGGGSQDVGYFLPVPAAAKQRPDEWSGAAGAEVFELWPNKEVEVTQF